MVERDDEGRPSKWVTEVEPEFDVNERDNWQALAEYEDALCPQCHQLRSICEDPEQLFYPQLHRCNATAATQASNRLWQKRHKDAKPDAAGYLPTDGTAVWVSEQDLTPDDDFI